MNKLLLAFISIALHFTTTAQTKTIHVFVALCDNQFQGIVPVPQALGDGKDPANNLYWGALYGVKSYFKRKAKNWKFVKSMPSSDPAVLDRILFKHASKDIYMLADAYDGEQIKKCTIDFLKATNHQNPISIEANGRQLQFGGKADLLTYIGHDGLMDFDVSVNYKSNPTPSKDVIILACFSQSYFTEDMKKANANPILWTTNLVAPEAYILQGALNGWVQNESGQQIDERAAQAYNRFQKCGINGARGLFTTGF